ncbi:hypothetical protein H8K35_15790 [Undibacterium sp. LX40W]|uniref:Uncharacterized protein n=1 Tax=Undibacterium nitidum TaxID=2762298 RepID=A0A923KU31_9BURK|nr:MULTISPECIES: hypothetical protein [Undibacterium]MBC3882856.1 hypothetical protein [Undibacterium nitidum]MBC3893137.1 hypothetical protein [Undibacterium sp. LX40W]
MSFIVQVTDIALPSDAAQRQKLVSRIIEEFHASDGEPSAKFAQLYQQLVAQYPCLSSYKDGTDECVWGDAPLINNFGQRIAILDIVQNEEQVLASVLKLAGDLGLKVIETQSDTVYFPNTPETQSFIVSHEKPVLKEEPLTERSVLHFIVERLMPILEPAGFTWKNREKWAIRTADYGTQCVWLGVEKKRDMFVLYITARFDIPSVCEVAKLITGDSSETGWIGCNYLFFTGQHTPPKVSRLEDLVQTTEIIEVLVKEKILPFFETTLSMITLNSSVNNSEKCKFYLSNFLVQAMSLAYLAQPARIQETADIYRGYVKFRNYPEENIMRINQLVNRLIDLNPTL